MPAIQTTYLERQAVATAGMIANMRTYDAITRTVETAAGIGFGLACGRGTNEKECVVGGALPIFLGVSIKDVTLDVVNSDKYPENANIGLLTMGEIWVQTSVAVDPGDPVHYDATTGIFAASGGTGPILGARWMETSAAGIGRLHLSGYGPATS